MFSTTNMIPLVLLMNSNHPSQPDKCPNCRNDENKKTVCRNCGYEYKDERIGWGSIVGISIFALILLLFFGWIGMIMDYEVHHGIYANRLIFGKACDYNIPKGYEMLYNPNTKYYIIRDSESECLDVDALLSIDFFPSTISEPALFTDSCVAKAVLKKYIGKTDGYKKTK